METTDTPFQKWYAIYIGLLAAGMIVLPKLIVLLLVAFIPLLIIGLRKKELQFKINPMGIAFVALYLLYAIYTVFTRHPDWAARYMENKLSFIIFPFIFAFVPRQRLKPGIPVVLFIGACLYLFIAGLVHSSGCYFFTHQGPECFFTVFFSYIHHPSYASVFFTAALFLNWYMWHTQWLRWPLWLAVGLSFLFVLAIGMCMSLAGMLFLFMSAGIAILILVFRRYGRKIGWSMVVALPLLFLLLERYEPHLHGEVESARLFATEYAHDPAAFIRTKKYPMSGTEVRLVMWTASAQAVADFPLGVGTGNVDEVLTAYLRKMDQPELAKLEYNPHNQFLQTALETGWLGGFVLIAILLIGLLKARKQRNWLLLVLTSALLFNMLFESMLQRQSGIVFFSFWLCLLTCDLFIRKPAVVAVLNTKEI